MTVSLLPSIFTIEIGGRPTLTFEAQNLGEAHELCHEEGFGPFQNTSKNNLLERPVEGPREAQGRPK
jgi:hypothetical protein